MKIKAGMKTLALFLGLAVCSLAGDGYDRQVQLVELVGGKPIEVRTGQVLKVTKFNAERDSASGPIVDVVMFYHKRYFGNEIKLKMTSQQWTMLEYASSAYLRKSWTGWELLGTQVYRDENGQTRYR